MVLVMKAHRELDLQCRSQAETAGMEVDNLTVADVAYPLVTQRLTGVFQQQLVHVRNGCISDDPDHLPYAEVGTINYHLTGHHLNHYQSLRGTSKVEAVHSVLDRNFYSQRGIGAEVFDVRLGWWIIMGYNRRRMRAHGKKSSSRQHDTKGMSLYYFLIVCVCVCVLCVCVCMLCVCMHAVCMYACCVYVCLRNFELTLHPFLGL